jgi:glutamate/tyrosine decarboxylase-like PLP-dependent enzyme
MSHDSQLFLHAAERAAAYLDTVDQRPVAPSAQAIAALDAFRQPLPEQGTSGQTVLDQLDRLGSPATMATNGGRFFGFVIGGAEPTALAAHCLSLAWDQNVGPRVLSPIGAVLEEVVTDWLCDLFALPADCAAAYVTGAGMASFTALGAARHALLARQGWNVEDDGLSGAPPLRVVVSDEVHPTVLKALAMLGLGRKQVERVATDAQGRMRLDALPELDGQTIVCTQAGNINSGAFDPLAEICQRAHQAGAWVHVDGAFGLWARAAPSLSPLAEGIEQADSWATDGHKWLNLPYENAVALVRDQHALNRAFSIRAPYLVESNAREPYDSTPELSRRIRGVDWWAALSALGRQGVAEQIARSCAQAQKIADGLYTAGWKVLNEVVLNQVTAIPPQGRVAEVVAQVQASGVCWVGPTLWQGQQAIRMSVSSCHTTDHDIARSLQALCEAAR